ncbi:MAG: translocation/assembly module TamB domain-containing protein [Burkholderiaceae bacterium]|nr:translocation/assembly module TamB domain-containing protein [Burkholderiaceae bacterium]
MLVWVGPFLVLLLLITAGFLYWVITTAPGTRWALVTAVQQFDGQIKGVDGTLWSGIQVESLDVTVPSVSIQANQLHLQFSWRELLERRLHVQDVSADSLQLDLISTPDTTPAQPFSMPELPVYIAVDRLAVGELAIRQDGEPLPVSIKQASLALALNNAGGQLVVQRLTLENSEVRLGLEGDLKALDLDQPWPFEAAFTLSAQALTQDSPLCARHYLATLPVAGSVSTTAAAGPIAVTKDGPVASAKQGVGVPPVAPIMCRVDIDAKASGSMDMLTVSLKGQGQDMTLDADAKVTLNSGFPVQEAHIALRLPDGSQLNSQVQHEALQVDEQTQDRVYGWLSSQKLDVGQLAGSVIPPAVISARVDFDLRLRNLMDILSADLNLVLEPDSRWNKQPLAGSLKAGVVQAPSASVSTTAAAADQAVTADQAPTWETLQISALDMDLTLGKNHIKAQGSLGSGDSKLALDVLAPHLAAFWPELPGGVTLKGDVQGSIPRHRLDLNARYTPEASTSDQVGTAPVEAKVVLQGGWGPGTAPNDALIGWRGSLESLKADHAGLGLVSAAPTPLSFVPDAVAPAWQWQVGKAELTASLSQRPVVTLSHQMSHGGAGRWETRGAIDKLAVSRRLIEDIQKKFNVQAVQKADRGGVKVRQQQANENLEIVFAADWDLQFNQALQGKVHFKRLSGDVIIPAQPPVPLGLQDLTLDLDIRKTAATSSTVDATLLVQTQKMGKVSATATTLLHATSGGGLYLEPKDIKTVKINAAIEDLGWTSLFLDDAMELGGAIQADVQLQSRADNRWTSSGTITGQGIKVLRIDDGVRLLDGTLEARLDDERLILERLYFPARLRAVPKEWRTAEWVSTNPDAKDGGLTLTGVWNIFDSAGQVAVDLYRYPILQRADRYAMVSGKINLDAALPAINITGGIVADAGWFDLDMLGGIPTVDSDVVVIRAGDEQQAPRVPMDISMDLEVDLGTRFYLTGYGVNSGLVGKMRVIMQNDKLTGIGALRTRGGAIEAYGQRLQLRRGLITFQGDITSPILDIEALRTGLAVEAGVKVGGNAKRPRIDLVSYPDVSEIEKLSWLLLGHGPDDSGGDVALLLSVGSSFLGTGEPFYRKFGIDEVSMRSGELGSAGSILPVESVVSGLDSGTSDIERRFIVVSKGFGQSLTLSVRQALSDTGTVGHASYQLMRNLTAELSVGTVNGLALVYRWLSRD